jgi:hypothetical protein
MDVAVSDNNSGLKTKNKLKNKREPTINSEYWRLFDDIQKLFFEAFTKKKFFISLI